MKFEFDTEIKGMPTMETAFIEFPFVVKETFGATRQLKVRANFDGYEYRSSLTKMGHYCHFLIIRKTIGKHPGETVHVIIEKDTEPHLVEVPTDFLEAMAAESKIKFFFDHLSYTHQNEYVHGITTAKKNSDPQLSHPKNVGNTPK
jgi:hypothetical protein